MLLVNNAILLFGVFGIVTAKSALRRSKAKSGRAAPYSRSSRTTDKNKKDDVASLADDLESLQVSSLPSAGLEGLLTGFDNFAINSQRGDDDKCYVEWNDEDAGMSIGISARKRPASNSYALDSISYRLNLAEPTPAKQVPAEFTFFLRMRLPGPVQSVAKYYVNLDAFIDTSLDVKHGETCKEQLDGRIRDGFRDDWQLIKKDGQEYYREEYGKYLLASDLLIRFRVSAKEKNFFAQDGNITREVGLAWNPSSRNFKITSLTITSPDPMTLPETPHSLDVLESMMHNFPSNPDYRAAAYRLLFYGETIGEQLGYTVSTKRQVIEHIHNFLLG